MKRTLTILWICGLLCVTVACDDTAETPLTHAPMALIDARADDIADTDPPIIDHSLSAEDADRAKYVVGEVVTESPIGVILAGMDKAEMKTDVLRWQVINLLDQPLQVTPVLQCEGLAAVRRDQTLQRLDLAARSTTTVEVAAADLPVQSHMGAGTVQVSFRITDPANPESETKRLSPMVYYRHSTDYRTVDVFTEDVLMKRYGGVIFQIPDAVERQNGEIGRVLDNGVMRTVSAMDEALEQTDKDGNSVRIVGNSLSEEPMDMDSLPLERTAEQTRSTTFSANVCFRRYVTWTDGPTQIIPARFTKARVRENAPTYQSLFFDYLNLSGCVNITGLKTSTQYTVSLLSEVSHQNRKIIVQAVNSPGCNEIPRWRHVTIQTGSAPTTQITVNASAGTPEERIAAIGTVLIDRRSQLQWNAPLTLIRPRPVSSATGTHLVPDECGGKIYINTTFTNPDGSIPDTLDHSTYRYVIGHELGHRQAWYEQGVWRQFERPMLWDTDSEHPCNCEHYSDYKDSCFQNRTYTGNRQVEAWAHFYAAALFGSRTAGGCANWEYWRSMYELSATGPKVNRLAPVRWNCGRNEQWLVSYCTVGNNFSRATNQDWLAFFWNVWANGGGLENLSVAEITSVWNMTNAPNVWGYEWLHLRASAMQRFQNDARKRNQFISRGFEARVDN